MIVAMADTITLTDLHLRAYEQMVEPKKLVTVEGGHFDPYQKQFPRASAAAYRGSARSWPRTLMKTELFAPIHGAGTSQMVVFMALAPESAPGILLMVD
jgi:hypothetical protein